MMFNITCDFGRNDSYGKYRVGKIISRSWHNIIYGYKYRVRWTLHDVFADQISDDILQLEQHYRRDVLIPHRPFYRILYRTFYVFVDPG